ncbi:MAG: hypothetical protein ACE5H3_05845 [Planctomycetota bacterium]
MKNPVRTAAIVFFTGASLFAGVGFLVKLYEFLVSIDDASIIGFAIAPLVNYALVACGFLALLVWAFLGGQFSDVEKTKYDFLEDQERFDREDPHLHPKGVEKQGGAA